MAKARLDLEEVLEARQDWEAAARARERLVAAGGEVTVDRLVEATAREGAKVMVGSAWEMETVVLVRDGAPWVRVVAKALGGDGGE